MPEPHLRAADADRAAVATRLGDQMSAGRLTVAEYDERLARAYAARTYGELEALTADLPQPAPQPVAVRTAHVPGQGASACGWSGGPSREAAWRNWAVVAVVVLTVWTATAIGSTDLPYFWPIWVIGPWGAVLLAQTLSRGRRDDARRRLT
ncbi:DUF1707 domain-containing protein [Geodermatophilus sp. DSM 45219]|uniref:DUF1707 SHOCT-like domain-containing protein n=1 Tax=Geodermatophilus sp. DSM 45219 TaxID=1881103 RepID=UPI0008858686|nr:DUF1707 domain-containing protein [Geodermatophilus sp. DSM 45219]SDO05050.1 protein of unknown function [Geodermatophilus sp. DSM 45219]